MSEPTVIPDVHVFSTRLTELRQKWQEYTLKREEAFAECENAAAAADQRLREIEAGDPDQSDRTEAEEAASLIEQNMHTVHAARLQRLESIFEQMEHNLKDTIRKLQADLKKKMQQAKDEAAQALEKAVESGRDNPTPYTDDVNRLEEEADTLQKKIDTFCTKRGVGLDEIPEPTALNFLEKIQKIETAIKDADDVIDQTKHTLHQITWSCWPAHKAAVFLIGLLFIAMHAAGFAFAYKFNVLEESWYGIAGSLVLSLLLFRLEVWLSRRRVHKTVYWLRNNIASAVGHLSHLEQAEREQLAYDATARNRRQRMREVFTEMQDELDTAEAENTAAQKELGMRFEAAKTKLSQRLEKRIQTFREDRVRAENMSRKEFKALVADTQKKNDSIKQQARAEREGKLESLKQEWEQTVADFDRFAEESREQIYAAVEKAEKEIFAEWPACIPVGQARINLDGILTAADDVFSDEPDESALVTVPIALGYPQRGAILVQAGNDDREHALDIIRRALLRIMASFPPAKAKATFIDPVGLGQNFSAFMRLADFDESLVHNRIWTEAGHIESRLTDLTEHMETVIQKYLRNQYATVAEYNQEAGAIAEPYQFLVISDFPSGFSELAYERLAAIIASGPRCGVFPLIMHDTRQKLPEQIDINALRKNGLVLRMEQGQLRLDHDNLRKAEFGADSMPDDGSLNQLLDTIGQQARDAERIELPFDAAVPQSDAIWSLNTDDDIRIPIGQAGADRLHYIELGKGTRQHALIGGRTGSGKSTLLHVLITNAALWYSPDQVEFYLIDFKKGVEFKRLAAYELPHARAIGIESDREFGLSVLRRIDEELTRRGELFRALGAQNLAGYRSGGGTETLPRTLLIIDEFQEFFTEDDTTARDAALYLDRFVRQGRAFGIHVILGSQTLSGVYSLSKSTLGQMGVRIALQCNESDSNLILGDDNTAARLLTRPGEAIYNDMSGLLEGNNPFQVVWLSEEVQEKYLGIIRDQAEAIKWQPAQPPVIFEGNAPSDITGNRELMALIKGETPTGEGPVWLGEASTIKGPTEIRFAENAGANLLITGQHREGAMAIFTAMLLGLAGRYQPGAIRFSILTTGGDDEYNAPFKALADSIPHEIAIVPPGGFAELFTECAQRWNDGQTDIPHYMFIFGIHRLRTLRQDEDLMFSLDRDAEVEVSEQFADILGEGPETGLHSIIWCDGLNNLNRTFSRKTLRNFDQKILFQMSAGDSTELIDDTSANNLGLHGALLSIESEGTREKFRPYAFPSPAQLITFQEALNRKYC